MTEQGRSLFGADWGTKDRACEITATRNPDGTYTVTSFRFLDGKGLKGPKGQEVPDADQARE